MNNLENNQSQEEFIDKIVNRVMAITGNNPPVKKVRDSQLLTALVGAVGFALFINGIEGLFSSFPDWALVTLGLALMALTGLLIHNLNR